MITRTLQFSILEQYVNAAASASRARIARYISLTQGVGSGGPAPRERHDPGLPDLPALDLTVLFNGFKPLFQALTPADVNRLSYEIVQVFQGEGGTVEGLLSHTASVTSTLADRDQLIGDLIDNLDQVLNHIGNRESQLSDLIVSFRQFVHGLKTDRQAILGTLDDISSLSVQTAGLVKGIRKPFVGDVHQLRAVAGNIDKNKAELDRALQVLPIKLQKVGRTAIYGSWFNFYLCEFHGRVQLRPARHREEVDPGGLQDRIGQVQPRMNHPTTSLAALPIRGGPGDERPVPFPQPRHHRRGEPGRHHDADPRRLPRPGPAADRWRRHLLRRVRRVRRAQGQRRGPHRRRPGRQGRERRARRGPREGHLPGEDRLALRLADGGRDPDQDAARARCTSPCSRPARASSPGREIPESRTSSPYDVVDAFSGLAQTSEQIDTDQLAKSFTTLADLTRNTPAAFRGALDGVARLSGNVAARDAKINSLLKNLKRSPGSSTPATRTSWR